MTRKLLILAVALAILAVGFGAGYTVSRASHPAIAEEPAPVAVAVDNGSVGRSMKFNAEIRNDTRLAATNTLTGMVAFVSTEAHFDTGDMVYAVNGTPVFVAPGDMPFYRELREGVTGKDVAQLNAMLDQLGYPVSVDESYGPVTRANVKKWQKDTGQPETGEILLGQLIALSPLPSGLVLDTDALKMGALLSGGEQLVSVPDGAPRFVLVVGESQSKLLSPGQPVVLSHDGQEWSGVIGQTTANEQTNSYEVEVVSETGESICTEDCPAQGSESSVVASVELVPTVTGPVVPRAAVMTDAAGASYVVMEDGQRRDVTVQGVADGIAVVEGVEAGESVRVFGDEG